MVIQIVDYGMGNLRSVSNALRSLGADAAITADPRTLARADAIVLPGVGAFGDGMRNLRAAGFVEALEEEVRRKGKPLLGLCLGLQLLATTGLEHGRHGGLDWVPGVVDRIPIPPDDPAVRLPHIGWNDVRVTRHKGLYDGLGDSQPFYFVHSYALTPEDPGVVTGVCSHGADFVASIEVDNLYATQFHPEKSHGPGLAVLRNFLAVVR